MALYLLDRLNIHHTYKVEDGFWIIDTEDVQFWFNYDGGSYYGTITKIPELEDI
jgi:hypothetical protein